MNGKTSIVDKIALLMAKAERTDNEFEAEMFFDAAQKLMIRHAIDDTMLKAAGKQSEKIVTIYIDIKTRDEIKSAKMLLLGRLARANRCKIVNDTRYNDRMIIIGYESDAEFVAILFASVMMQYATQRNLAWKNRREDMTTSRYLWVNSFSSGYAERVGIRLQEMATKATEETGMSTALVLRDRSKDVDEWLTANMSLRKGRSVSVHRGTGYVSGYDAGSKADLSGGRNNLVGRKTLGS